MPRPAAVAKISAACGLLLLLGSRSVDAFAAPGVNELLWDTTGGVGSRPGGTSQSVLALGPLGQPLADSEIADDFAAHARIRRLDFWGIPCFCQTPPVAGVFARFYEWTADGPGPQQGEFFLEADDPRFVYHPEQPSRLDITLPDGGFAASGLHFVAVQLVFSGGGAWSMLQSNPNEPRHASLWFRDRLESTAWEPEKYHGRVVSSSDFAFRLYGDSLGAATIDSIGPDPADRSERIVILGSDFGDGTDSRVTVDGRPASATTWRPDEIHAYVPEASALGPVEVRVVTPEGASPPATLTVTARAPEGRVRWRFRTDGDRTYSQFVTVGPDGAIYTADRLGTYALSPDGALRWFTPDARGADGEGGRPLSIGADGTLYTGMDVVGDAYAAVVALDPDDGSVLWRFVAPNTGPIDVGPNVGPDGRIYGVQTVVPNAGLGAFALEPEDGQLAWSEAGDPPFDGLSSLTNSEIVFGADRLYAGAWFLRSGSPVIYAFALDGEQVWTSWELQHTATAFPVVDPFDRVITRWGQTGLRALTPDGEEAWVRIHPDQVNVERPAVDSVGNSYTGNASSVRLWSVDPDGETRWIRPSEFPDGLDELGVTPDDRLLVAGGSAGPDAPQWVRGYRTKDGILLWQVDLPDEQGLSQFTSSMEPRFSADSATAYVTTQFPGDGLDYGYLWAIATE
jgi:outer membrane protein assembly factor BamB